ncbi:MAG TPA: carboxypeptidase regulatory-like domain-containing protein, partial [Actinomycetota bacterium]|nr:carboxypeptidase regulatory-like domain-containing protein [Actinomycetota bacterium]
LWQIFANRGMGFFASAIDGGDVQPVQDFSLPPDCSTGCATVSGTLTDSITHNPVRGALVGLAGHMSGLASDLAATTDGSGHYSIPNVPFHTYEMVVKASGYEPLVASKSVSSTNQTINLKAVRDWASLSGGARLTAFTRPDYTPFGCGPAGAIDGTLSSGWGSDSPNNKHSGVKGPRSITVKLPKPVDIKAFAVASNGTCGDGRDAAVKGFLIQTRSGRHPWMTAVVNNANFKLGQFVIFRPTKGTNDHVTFVRFTMTSNHGNPLFMDMLEVSVRGQ